MQGGMLANMTHDREQETKAHLHTLVQDGIAGIAGGFGVGGHLLGCRQ